jgi:hypothetical protein
LKLLRAAESAHLVNSLVSVGYSDGEAGRKSVVPQPAVNMQGVEAVLQICLEKSHNLESQWFHAV